MYQASAPGPHDVLNHVRRPARRWRPRPQGAERLFNYMEASDSEEEMLPEDLVCQQCGLEFLDGVSLQTHLMSMHRMTLAPQTQQAVDGRPYHCTICGYSSPSHPDIVEHMQKHAVVELRCLEPGCRYASSVPGAMEEHARLAHPSLPPLNQKCPHCGFVVLSATALSRHAKTHHLANVQCGACTRLHQRFERHRSGELWSEEDQEDDEELMAAAAQAAEAAVNAIEEDDDGGDVGGVGDSVVGLAARGGSGSHHERALRALRRQWLTRRRRVLRFRVMRRDLRSLLDSYPEGEAASAAQRLRAKQVGRWLARRRLACYACPPARRLTWPVHSPASMAAHRAWRHRPAAGAYPCDSCDARFRHRYQALLHASRAHAEVHEEPVQAEVEAAQAAQAAQPAGHVAHAVIAEPIVTLTVPQYLAASVTTTAPTLAALDAAPADPQLAEHAQLQSFQQLHAHPMQVYHAQVQAADPGQEAYTLDDARITVVPVLYTCAQPQGQPDAQQIGDELSAQPLTQPQAAEPLAEAMSEADHQFQAPMYNGMMVPTVPTTAVSTVPKQVWYPQLATPSYYISTQFPST